MAAKKKNNGNGKTAGVVKYPTYPPIQHRSGVGDLVRTGKAVCEVLDACGIDSGLEAEEAGDLMMGCRAALSAAIRQVERWGDDPDEDFYAVCPNHPLRHEAIKAIVKLAEASNHKLLQLAA
jgi:hypothetical protein